MATTVLMYVLPAIEAVVIVLLLGVCARWKRRALLAETRIANIKATVNTQFVPPSKQQMDDYRKRYPDFRQNSGFPSPPPSMVARFKNKD